MAITGETNFLCQLVHVKNIARFQCSQNSSGGHIEGLGGPDPARGRMFDTPELGNSM